MDEGQDRRDRLARLQLERMSRQPKDGFSSNLGRQVDRWSGFGGGAAWERLFFAGAILLVAALAIGGLFMIITSVMGGKDGEKNAAANAPRSTATRSAETALKPTATAIVIAVPTYPTALPTARLECADIQGGDYRDAAERDFYLENCVGSPDAPTDEPTPPPDDDPYEPPEPTEPPPEPTEPPPTPAGFGASDAIDAASYWLGSAGYSNIGSCNTFNSGSHWVVTCGATGPSGPTTVSVCVFPSPLAVRPSDQC
jgi:hypothetical protein